jgi:hypothetical protein
MPQPDIPAALHRTQTQRQSQPLGQLLRRFKCNQEIRHQPILLSAAFDSATSLSIHSAESRNQPRIKV